ncbi:MAG: carboxypeptidase regulatory-like domain-containing protein [Bacteroidales bacterium]|nr:carboxypeptidase regulatory-like domain-containing protein [Bacteroidales bacterium]
MVQTLKKGFAALVAFLAGAVAFAQVTTSSLAGQISDETGEPLAGAAVIAIHTPSGTQYATVANGEGRYVINGMRVGGPYKINISFIGMGELNYEGITLKLGEPYELNASMKSTNELEAVVLTAEGSFNSHKTGAGASFDLKTVENMPSIDRSIYDVVKFTPQATVNKSGGISFAGANNRYNSFQVDGAVANDSFGLASSGTNGGQTGANPISLDAIEEIQVVVAPFDVRQSGFTGGAINTITKSGTNTVKGSAYSYLFNQDFIGTTPGKDVENRTKYQEETSQTYGFTVGGPIIKNKLFFFVSGELYKFSYPNVYFPTDGDANAYGKKTLGADVIYNGQNLGNVFNATMAQAMINHYEKQYGLSNTGESFGQHQKDTRSINGMARIDWNINQSNKFMFRYQIADSYADQYGSGASTYYFNGSSYKQVNKTHTFVGELNSRISDNVSNELRATAVLVRDHREPGYKGATMYIKDKITFNLGTEYSSGVNSMNSNTYTFTDNLSIFKGNHTITLGTHDEIFNFANGFIQYAYGEYIFNSVADFFDNKLNQYEYKYVDPNLTGGDTMWVATTWAAEFGAYLQDEWKPSRNFTLTYGVRADVPVLLNKPSTNETFNGNNIAKRFDQYTGVTPKATPLWSPRVGFRWYLNDNHTSLLRGGTGLFTGRVPFVWLSNAYNNTGVETKSVTIKKSALPENMYYGSDPYTGVVKAGLASGDGAAQTINTLSKDFKYPQVFRTNIGFEQTWGDGWKLTIDALYSKTLNNIFFQNLAVEESGKFVYGATGKGAEYPGGGTIISADKVAPYYTNIKADDGNAYSAIVALGNTNKGYSYSTSVQIQKSFRFGLDLMASYTYGHSYSVNDGTSSVAYSNWKYNYSVNTNSPELSYSLFDKPHKLMAMISYNSPVYAKRFGTNIALTYEGGSGQRFSYTMSEKVDFNGDGYMGNSLMYIPTQQELTEMKWATPADAASFENFIRGDRYLASHGGQWTERYAGMAPFEHHFDLHIGEDFYYDRKHGRKLQLFADFKNISNLFNRGWGLYYASAYNRSILQVTAVDADAKGNMVPTYAWNDYTVTPSDFYSRWRCQLGIRLSF